MYTSPEVKAGLESRGYVEIYLYQDGNSGYSPQVSTFIKKELKDSHPCDDGAYEVRRLGRYPHKNPADAYKRRVQWTTIQIITPCMDGHYVLGTTYDAESSTSEDIPPLRYTTDTWLVDKKARDRRKDGLTQLFADLL